ncbi:MAG: prolyl oligopeptidase family serine peptidase [Phycisphaerales bacterium]|nr:prolyl oligopeptidase family serine peptidase [Phycisphaerales bacterium]
MNPGGGARSYGTIAPGEVKRQHTYSGHAWRFDRPDGSVVGRCEGAEDIAAIVLADAPLPGAQRRESEAPPEPQLGQPSQPPEVPRAVLRDGGLQIAPAGSADFSPVDLGLPGGYRASGPLLLSPNGRHALFLAARPAPEHIVTLVESSPPDQVQPRTLQFNYPKPGDEIDAVMPVLVDLASASRIPIDDALFPTPWSLDRFEWDNDGSGFTFLYNQRGHQVMRVLHVEAASGAARAIVDEACPTFFDYTNKTFLHRVHATGELIWMSERDGWNHLYLYDERAGRLKNQITSGDFVVRRVEWVDEARRQVWFSACGLDPSGEPYYIHFCRVNFDGSGFVVLTRDASGTHEVEFSPDKRSFIDSFSTTELPPQAVLRRADDGRPIAVLGAPSLDLFTRTGFTPPERFTAKGRDGATDICGLIFRPSNFDPAKTYPVIENIYAGPHDAHVPKSFTVRYGLTDLVELGFIVVRIDGMGTNWRSKSFHDVCWKNLVDAGLPDRIAWMKAAQDGVCPQMDLTRVGIYGGSAGGQNALAALLTHPEFYKAAAADCGCHDNRMDKIWWNEMWMGWPVGPHYARQSNVTLAPNLRGRLLLTVGELDQNVDPASTMQVVNALIKADKDFELIVVPGAGHGAGESPYAARRRQDFFVRALMGVEPRWE